MVMTMTITIPAPKLGSAAYNAGLEGPHYQAHVKPEDAIGLG